jgi:hypothetical protein
MTASFAGPRRRRRWTSPWRSSTAWTVLIAGSCSPSERCRSFSRIFGARQPGYSRFKHDDRLDGRGQPIRLAIGPPAPVTERLHAAVFVGNWGNQITRTAWSALGRREWLHIKHEFDSYSEFEMG